MTFSRGGTIFLNGKTYNVSQINSVYIGEVNEFSTFWVFLLWFIGGLFSFAIAGKSMGIWFILTIISIYSLVFTINQKKSAVFFDLSSGKVDAYSGKNYNEVKQIADDIIRGMEEGYFPNYLRKGQ